MSFFEIFIISVVEGLTELLPISSTGHMIIVSYFLGIEQTTVVKSFEVIIQVGAIAAITYFYRARLRHVVRLWPQLLIAFVPVGAVGFLMADYIKALFDKPVVIAWAFIVGGIILIFTERVLGPRDASVGTDLQDVTRKQALGVGLAQICALIPGTSRSAATIVGGMACRLSRQSAIEFSFLLAVPVMLATTVFDLFALGSVMDQGVALMIVVGVIVAFVVTYASIIFLLAFIQRFDLSWFGYYRVLLGLFLLISLT